MRLLLQLIACVTFGIATVIVVDWYSLPSGHTCNWVLCAEKDLVRQETVKLLVATRNIDMGQTFSAPEQFFELVDYPKSKAPINAIVDAEKLQDAVVKVSLRKGEPISDEHLLRPCGSMGSISPSGYRALGLRCPITECQRCSGTPRRLHIIVTEKVGTLRWRSRALVESAAVLAVSQPDGVITVALTQEDCLRVSFAKEKRTISLTCSHASFRHDATPSVVEQILNAK